MPFTSLRKSNSKVFIKLTLEARFSFFIFIFIDSRKDGLVDSYVDFTMKVPTPYKSFRSFFMPMNDPNFFIFVI